MTGTFQCVRARYSKGPQDDKAALLNRLRGLQEAVALIRRTAEKDERRVMLGFLLRDLQRLEGVDLQAISPEKAALLVDLRRVAQELRASLGRPLAPIDGRNHGRRIYQEVPANGSSRGESHPPIRGAPRHERRKQERGAPPSRGLQALCGTGEGSVPTGGVSRGLRAGTGEGRKRTRDLGESGTGANPSIPTSAEDQTARRLTELIAEQKPLSATEWHNLGFNRVAAKHLADRAATISQLSRMRQRELRNIEGIGDLSIKLIERLLGKPIPADPPEPPLGHYWRSRGLPPPAARALTEAGFETVEDLSGVRREELAAIRNVGNVVIARLEELVGRLFPRRDSRWARLGLPTRVANALHRAGVHTEADFLALTRERFLLIDGMAESSLRLCEAAVGRKLPSPLRSWRARGVTRKLGRKLVAAGIETRDQLRKLTISDLRALGFDWTEIAHCERLKE